MTDKIKISLIKTASNLMIGCICLHKPTALNALDLDMVKALQIQLDLWRNDSSIGAIFLDGEGEKAFCAGGDVVTMYKAMVKEKTINPNQLPKFMAEFFEREYRLDYSIHTFPKPIICWGNGIIMGGGLGLFAGASHKIVTESARIAMPELTIGLFPDVGASYFLNKLPKGVGKFLGLTSCSINAVDCINIGLASHFLLNDEKESFLSKLTNLNLLTKETIDAVLNELNDKSATKSVWLALVGKLSSFILDLNKLEALEKGKEIAAYLEELVIKHPNNKLLTIALASFNNGSPLSAALFVEQLKRGQTLSLAECFQMELNMAYQCGISGEFQEGVRALLIDKDNQANWLFQNLDDIPNDFIQAHFDHFKNQHSNKMNEQPIENPLQSLVTLYGEAYV